MGEKISQLKKYSIWAKERFPVPAVILLSASMYYLSYFYANLFKTKGPVNWIETILGVAVIFFVMLHLRVFDEHKDYEKDRVAHPDRALSKGIITLKDLRVLMAAAIIIEIAASAYIGLEQLIVWSIIMLWSFLMLVEFFCPEFLNRRIGLYLLTHQLLIPIIVFFGFSQRYNLLETSGSDLKWIILFPLYVMCVSITYEISRKTWSEDREHELADSYTKVWGRTKTVIINQAVALCGGGILLYIYISFKISAIYMALLSGFYLLFLLSEILFLVKPENKNSKIVEAGGILFMLGLFISSMAAFYNY